jgi:hypothetical protein
MNEIKESWAAVIRAKAERWDTAIAELKILIVDLLQIEISVKAATDKKAQEYQEYLVGIIDPRD